MINSHTFHVKGSEINQHGITSHPDFLTLLMTDQQAMQLIEVLAYKLSHKQPIELVYSGSLVANTPTPARCPICNWPRSLHEVDTVSTHCAEAELEEEHA